MFPKEHTTNLGIHDHGNHLIYSCLKNKQDTGFTWSKFNAHNCAYLVIFKRASTPFLFDNCRNTKYIHNSAYQYYKGTEVDAPDLEGEPIQAIEKPSLEQQAKEIDNTVSRLINTENIKPEDIAIIIIGSFDEAHQLLENTKNKHLWAFKEFLPTSKVLVETAKRFKGLESPIIFLWIIGEEEITDELLYVSISRARFRLWIIGTAQIIKVTNVMEVI